MSSTQVMAQLRAALQRIDCPFESSTSTSNSLNNRPIRTGSDWLDELPGDGGWPRGSLVEWLAGDVQPAQGVGQSSEQLTHSHGASWLSLYVAWRACEESRMLVVLDRPGSCFGGSCFGGRFYPPAAAGLGVELERMVVLRPRNDQEAIWGMDQALRCPGVGAVWACWEQLDSRVFRRLQLAAEDGEALGMLVRPGLVRGQPSWAHLQLLVESTRAGPYQLSSCGMARRWRVEVLRRRSSSRTQADFCGV